MKRFDLVTSPMRPFTTRAARIAAWLLTVAIVVLSVAPPWLRPETGAPHGVEHFAIFFTTGVAFGIGYSVKQAAMMAGLVIFAGAIEFAQVFVPGRHARLSDFVIDALALCVGVAVTSVFAARLTANTS
jgi:VanZ family protein